MRRHGPASWRRLWGWRSTAHRAGNERDQRRERPEHEGSSHRGFEGTIVTGWKTARTAGSRRRRLQPGSLARPRQVIHQYVLEHPLITAADRNTWPRTSAARRHVKRGSERTGKRAAGGAAGIGVGVVDCHLDAGRRGSWTTMRSSVIISSQSNPSGAGSSTAGISLPSTASASRCVKYPSGPSFGRGGRSPAPPLCRPQRGAPRRVRTPAPPRAASNRI